MDAANDEDDGAADDVDCGDAQQGGDHPHLPPPPV